MWDAASSCLGPDPLSLHTETLGELFCRQQAVHVAAVRIPKIAKLRVFIRHTTLSAHPTTLGPARQQLVDALQPVAITGTAWPRAWAGRALTSKAGRRGPEHAPHPGAALRIANSPHFGEARCDPRRVGIRE